MTTTNLFTTLPVPAADQTGQSAMNHHSPIPGAARKPKAGRAKRIAAAMAVMLGLALTASPAQEGFAASRVNPPQDARIPPPADAAVPPYVQG